MKKTLNSTLSTLKFSRGFTLVELLLAMSIFGILAGISTLNLSNVSQSAKLSTSVNTLINDIKRQQIKAMTGDTEGRAATDDYGIYFGTTSYTLYHGNYNSGESTNFVISLPVNLRFSNVSFPSSQIRFLRGSGDINNFTNGSNAITILDTTNNQQKTIQLNVYGVVTAIN